MIALASLQPMVPEVTYSLPCTYRVPAPCRAPHAPPAPGLSDAERVCCVEGPDVDRVGAGALAAEVLADDAPVASTLVVDVLGAGVPVADVLAEEALMAVPLVAGVLAVESLLAPLHPANSTAVPSSPRAPVIEIR
ncbi:hypothetical protein C0Z11_00400 [Acidipropionibacterium jensenii]|nr:hypothetical protein C0Z11_00400 [Acidipropionibacterium jensenii]